VWSEAVPAVGGVGSAKVSGEPTAVANACACAAAAVRMGRWSCGGTPPGTSEQHYRMELPHLPIIGFLVGMDCIVHDHDVADEL
jgi:hypothetical protein